MAQRLFEQRVVLLHGTLDDRTATRVSAELMTLDAEGDAAVSLRIDCAGGSLALGLTLMDVIELLGVPVRALCMGQVGGPAVGVLAVCGHRAALPSTRVHLCEPTTQMEAHVREVEQWAHVRADERRRFCERLAAAAGRPRPRWPGTWPPAGSWALGRRWPTACSTRYADPTPRSASCPGHRSDFVPATDRVSTMRPP